MSFWDVSSEWWLLCAKGVRISFIARHFFQVQQSQVLSFSCQNLPWPQQSLQEVHWQVRGRKRAIPTWPFKRRYGTFSICTADSTGMAYVLSPYSKEEIITRCSSCRSIHSSIALMRKLIPNFTLANMTPFVAIHLHPGICEPLLSSSVFSPHKIKCRYSRAKIRIASSNCGFNASVLVECTPSDDTVSSVFVFPSTRRNTDTWVFSYILK